MMGMLVQMQRLATAIDGQRWAASYPGGGYGEIICWQMYMPSYSKHDVIWVRYPFSDFGVALVQRAKSEGSDRHLVGCVNDAPLSLNNQNGC